MELKPICSNHYQTTLASIRTQLLILCFEAQTSCNNVAKLKSTDKSEQASEAKNTPELETNGHMTNTTTSFNGIYIKAIKNSNALIVIVYHYFIKNIGRVYPVIYILSPKSFIQVQTKYFGIHC